MKKYSFILLIVFLYQISFSQNDSIKSFENLKYDISLINYIKDIRSDLTEEEYRNLLNQSYKVKDLDSNSFYMNRFRAIAHSELFRPDSAIFYAKKIVGFKTVKELLPYDMIDPYGVLAFNYYKYQEIDSAFKYTELAVNMMRSIEGLPDIEFVRLSRNYQLASIVVLKASNDKRDRFKKWIIIIVINSIILISLMVSYSRKKRKKITTQVEFFRKRFEELNVKKQTQSYGVDDETKKRILNDLNRIETSELFLNKDFNLTVLAKTINTNTSYLSKIINTHKGKTFKQYLIELRINTLIKNLDENPVMRKYSIEALAESIGYTNASSFTRIFKNYLGESPSAFLKKKYAD